MRSTIDVDSLPPPPAGMYYDNPIGLGNTCVWVHALDRAKYGLGVEDMTSWCIDQYEIDGRTLWRLESAATGWNQPHDGMCGFETTKAACEALRNYVTVLGIDHYANNR